MSKIKIQYFGPIMEGYAEQDGWMDIKKVTVFTGNQGSGKSTVAKLISTMSWIEKAIVKGILGQDELNTHNRFLKQLAFQRIDEYISDKTVIEYTGKAFTLKYAYGNFTASKSTPNGYMLPKIMYVPAERNLLSAVDRPDKLKNLPSLLYAFNEELDAAKNKFADGIDLPINHTRFEFDKLNKLAHILGENRSYKLRLSESSSGFQSFVPLYLVTKYLSDRLTIEDDLSIKEISLEEQKKIDKEVKNIMDDTQLTPDIRQAYLRNLSAKRKPGCFINIVEEPEQNLFPISQQKVLHSLLAFNNMTEENKLIMTTHSPYLINYLTLAVKADILKNKIQQADLMDQLQKIVPVTSTVKPDDWVIYELDETDGSIKKLESFNSLPSDENELNEKLEESNELFAQLLEIQQSL